MQVLKDVFGSPAVLLDFGKGGGNHRDSVYYTFCCFKFESFRNK